MLSPSRGEVRVVEAQPEPRSMREGNELVGWGMATGIWEAMQLPASARAMPDRQRQRRDRERDGRHRARHLYDDGPARRRDAGRAARERDGEARRFALPDAPVEGGSFTTSSVGSAIHAACRAVQKELLRLAQKADGSPLAGAKLDDVVFADGKIRHKADAGRDVSLADAMRAGKAERIEKEASADPEDGQQIRALHALGGVRRGQDRRGARRDPGHARRQRGCGRAASSIPSSPAARFSARWSAASAWRCTRRR